MASLQAWVSEHKLASVGTVWASAVGASLAYAKKKGTVLKPSLRLIHARMHAQALTLAVLSGAAAMHYLEANNIQLMGGGGSDVDNDDKGSVPRQAFDPIADW